MNFHMKCQHGLSAPMRMKMTATHSRVCRRLSGNWEFKRRYFSQGTANEVICGEMLSQCESLQFITLCCAFYVWTRLSNGLHHASLPGSVLEITISSSGGTERGPKRTSLSNMLLKFEGSRSISALSRGYFTGRREMSSGYLNWSVPPQRTVFHLYSLWWSRSLRGSASATRPIFIWRENHRPPRPWAELKTKYLLCGKSLGFISLTMWNAKKKKRCETKRRLSWLESQHCHQQHRGSESLQVWAPLLASV